MHRPSGHLTFLLQARALSQPSTTLSALPTFTPTAITGRASAPSAVSTAVSASLPGHPPKLATSSMSPESVRRKSSKIMSLIRNPSFSRGGIAAALSKQGVLPPLAKAISIQQPETPTASNSAQAPKSMRHSASVPFFQVQRTVGKLWIL